MLVEPEPSPMRAYPSPVRNGSPWRPDSSSDFAPQERSVPSLRCFHKRGMLDVVLQIAIGGARWDRSSTRARRCRPRPAGRDARRGSRRSPARDSRRCARRCRAKRSGESSGSSITIFMPSAHSRVRGLRAFRTFGRALCRSGPTGPSPTTVSCARTSMPGMKPSAGIAVLVHALIGEANAVRLLCRRSSGSADRECPARSAPVRSP